MEIRNFLEDNSRFAKIGINPPEEGGAPITIRGTIRNEKGQALKYVKIFVFQTDANGYYAPDDSINHTMNESDCRLFGYLMTDELGHYEFHTIHPGTYPNKYQYRFIPQHIHVEINISGYHPYSIQMAFEDDPAMKDPYWQHWASDLKFPVIHFRKENNERVGDYDIILSPK